MESEPERASEEAGAGVGEGLGVMRLVPEVLQRIAVIIALEAWVMSRRAAPVVSRFSLLPS